jgi:tRNA(fMet)-specific endonuclease VapC
VSLLVLDTNVVSYFMKGGPLAEAYRGLLRGNDLAISFMTVAELYEGAYRAAWSTSKLVRLESVLSGYAIIPSSPAVCRAWARIREQRRSQPISVDDAWIAASALAWSAELATHNPRDFVGISALGVITARDPRAG